MQRNATKARTASPPFLRRTSTSKSPDIHITSESIAADLVAFRKQGGRIEVLGNTPLRANVTAFRSRGTVQRKQAAAKTTAKTAVKA